MSYIYLPFLLGSTTSRDLGLPATGFLNLIFCPQLESQSSRWETFERSVRRQTGRTGVVCNGNFKGTTISKNPFLPVGHSVPPHVQLKRLHLVALLIYRATGCDERKAKQSSIQFDEHNTSLPIHENSNSILRSFPHD